MGCCIVFDYKKIIKSRALRLKILDILSFIPDEWMIKIQYRIKTGRVLDICNPKRYTEKLQWYKLYYKNPLMAKCVDKYEVRNFIISKGYANILNICYGIYIKEDDIDFSMLPNSFVLKDTLGGGSNDIIIVKNKNEIDISEIKNIISTWVHKSYRKKNCAREWVYEGKKHRIIIEKLIAASSDEGLIDWKFFCFNGKVEFVYRLGNRQIGKSVECGILDRNGVLLDVYRTDELQPSKKIVLPNQFMDMVKIAEDLSADFPHVRVDLYNENETIIFGELTFFPGSGYMNFIPDDFDIKIGEKFKLLTYN